MNALVKKIVYMLTMIGMRLKRIQWVIMLIKLGWLNSIRVVKLGCHA